MNKEQIQIHLNTNKSLKVIAEELEVSQTNLRYWIKKYELIRTNPFKLNSTNCNHCGAESSKSFCSSKCKSLFYYYKNKEVVDEKSKIYSKNKRENFKLLAISYGGNKCKHCNYNKNYSALSFHHTDPTQKDFPLAGIRSNVLKEEHKIELDKCILVCHNCHFKIHAAWNNLIDKGKQSIKGSKVRRQLIEYKGRKVY